MCIGRGWRGWLQGLGVAGILAGSGVLGASTVGGGENTPLGVVLALTSAAMYAVYQVRNPLVSSITHNAALEYK